VKRNAVTTLDVIAAQHGHEATEGYQGSKQSPVLAVGKSNLFLI
jgi:hypothetical protein